MLAGGREPPPASPSPPERPSYFEVLEPLEPVDPALPLLPGGVVLLPVPPAELPGGVPGEPGLEGEVADRLLEGLPGAPPLVFGLLP